MSERPSTRSRASAGRPSAPKEVGAEWAELLCLLPNYSPFKSPGGAWFDASKAQAAIAFIEECIHHVEGEMSGKPFKLQPWQKAFVANLFGWLRQDAKGRVVRRYREALLFVSRKNGKTPLAAAVALYVFFCDGEKGQQDYVAAAEREQAGMLFRQAKGMIELSPQLRAACRIYGGNAAAGQSRSVVRESDGSFLRVIAADANTQHGGNTHLVIIDELHAQPNRDLVDVLTTSTASENRAQPLTLYLTTADYNRPSICNEVYARGVAARDAQPGEAGDDPSFLPAIYEAKKTDDWRDEAVWAKANPNLGVSVSIDYLRREVKRAESSLPYRSIFLRLHLNMQTDAAEGAIDLLQWDAMAGGVDDEDLAGRDCWGGLDLSSTTDLSAFALVFPLEDEDERMAVRVWMWAPSATAHRRSREDRVPYESWGEEGFVTLTDGNAIDHDVIRRDVNEICERYNVKSIGADQYNAVQLLIQLRGDGLPVEKFGQGFFSMSPAVKALLTLVAEGRLLHGGNPALRWMAGNFMLDKDPAENLKPTKKRSPDRIDGMVALTMAVGKWAADESLNEVPRVEVW